MRAGTSDVGTLPEIPVPPLPLDRPRAETRAHRNPQSTVAEATLAPVAPERRNMTPSPTNSQGMRSRLFVKYVALFVGVVALALLANGASQIWFFFQEHRASLIRIQHEKAEAAAAKIDQFLNEIESQLGWTVQLPWRASTLPQRQTDAWRLFRQVPAITELTQLDPSGREQLRVSRLVAPDVLGSGTDYSKDPKFLEAVAHKIYYGPVYFRNNSEPYLTLALAGDRDAGVSIAEVNLKLIWDVVSQMKLGEHGQAYVVDGRGRLIAHPDISLVLSNLDLSHLAQVREALKTLTDGSATTLQTAKNLQGEEVLTVSSRIPSLDWLVFVELPTDEAYAPLRATVTRTGWLFLGALALAGLAGTLLARKMVVPIQALRAGAARIGSGDLGQRISIKTGDEIEQLAEQFNDMATRLQDSYSDLERKVESRTRELTQSVSELRALGEISQAVNSTLDLESVLTTIVANAVQLSSTDAGAIYVFEDTQDEFALSATYGMDAATVGALKKLRIRLDSPALAPAIARREPVQIPDLHDEPPDSVNRVILSAGYRGLLIAPLLRADRIVGMLIVRRKEPGLFPKATIEMLRTFADQSVLAIQNARLFSEIAQKSRQLETESRHKSQFLANMSHELRTPLNAILGYNQLMLNNIYGETNDRMRTVLARVQSNGKHLLGLINDVLDLSKIEAGQLTLTVSDYSMKQIVYSVSAAVEPLLAEKRLGFKVDIPADLPPGRGDGRRLTQVLLNLVSNAIKFTDAGVVSISVKPTDRDFTVAIRDTGPGIAAADQVRIFEEFQQADSSVTKKKGGSGLGLSIAKRIVNMHGGDLWVESDVGYGATFYFKIPISVDHREAKQ
jgi:signal transduction histidine kinase